MSWKEWFALSSCSATLEGPSRVAVSLANLLYCITGTTSEAFLLEDVRIISFELHNFIWATNTPRRELSLYKNEPLQQSSRKACSWKARPAMAITPWQRCICVGLLRIVMGAVPAEKPSPFGRARLYSHYMTIIGKVRFCHDAPPHVAESNQHRKLVRFFPLVPTCKRTTWPSPLTAVRRSFVLMRKQLQHPSVVIVTVPICAHMCFMMSLLWWPTAPLRPTYRPPNNDLCDLSRGAAAVLPVYYRVLWEHSSASWRIIVSVSDCPEEKLFHNREQSCFYSCNVFILHVLLLRTTFSVHLQTTAKRVSFTR